MKFLEHEGNKTFIHERYENKNKRLDFHRLLRIVKNYVTLIEIWWTYKLLYPSQG